MPRWTLPGSTLGAGCLTLAGDAAHPMTPNLGQGGCTALEVRSFVTRLGGLFPTNMAHLPLRCESQWTECMRSSRLIAGCDLYQTQSLRSTVHTIPQVHAVMQDGIILARSLRDALPAPGSRPESGAVPAALRDYERQRTRRTFPIAARSWVFGALLQIPLAPVRDMAPSVPSCDLLDQHT